jgi:hypothetical protein
MSFKLKKIVLLLSLLGTGFPVATAEVPDQDSAADRIVGSNAHTAGQG